MKPKVSVIVPIFNVERYLPECIESILNQTEKNLEIICINDGSTDNSLAILQSYADKDSRIHIIDKQNAGYGAAMNDGINCAHGEYIGIVESDDYILPAMYETLYQAAEQFNYPQIVKSDFARFIGEGEDRTFQSVVLSENEAYYNQVTHPSKDSEMLRANGINPPGIYRKDFIDEYGIRFNETPGASYQDNGFWFQLFVFAENAVFLKDQLYMVRRDNPNSSVKNKAKVYASCGEYDYIRNILLEKKPSCPNALEMCAFIRFGNYLWTISRIAPEFRREFIYRFHTDFKFLRDNNELLQDLYSPGEWSTVNWIINDPEEYYFAKWHDFKSPKLDHNPIKTLENELEKRDAQHTKDLGDLEKCRQRVKDLESCRSYRVGRAVTSVPRAIKRMLKK